MGKLQLFHLCNFDVNLGKPQKNLSQTDKLIHKQGQRRAAGQKVRECANLCHKRSRNLFYVANNLVAQNARIPCRQKKRHSMWVLLRSGVFEISVLQTIRNASRTDPDFTQVNTPFELHLQALDSCHGSSMPGLPYATMLHAQLLSIDRC